MPEPSSLNLQDVDETTTVIELEDGSLEALAHAQQQLVQLVNELASFDTECHRMMP